MTINNVKENRADSSNTREAAKTAEDITVLGIMAGDMRYLVHMNEISEVIQVTDIVPAPLTHSWFLGLINVHGHLYGITDLAAYLNGKTSSFDAKSRILLVSSNFKINSGFIANSLLGIRNLSEFELKNTSEEQLPNGVTQVYQDKQGRQWYLLSLRNLIREKRFLQIAR